MITNAEELYSSEQCFPYQWIIEVGYKNPAVLCVSFQSALKGTKEKHFSDLWWGVQPAQQAFYSDQVYLKLISDKCPVEEFYVAGCPGSLDLWDFSDSTLYDPINMEKLVHL